MLQKDTHKDIGNRRLYVTKMGKRFWMLLNEEQDTVVFKDDRDVEFGEFVFNYRDDGTYKLVRMYTEPHNGCGLGRQALQFFRKKTNAEIYVSPTDGQTRDDQSHLTGHALFFVSKMIAEGLIEDYDNDENRALFFDF